MRLIASVLAGLALFITSSAHGQALPAALRDAGVTQGQWDAIRVEARTAAARAQIAESAVLAAAERAGINLVNSGRFDASEVSAAVVAQIASQAQIIRDLQDRLEVLARADDPEIARLLSQANVAIAEGRLDAADALLAAAERSDLAAVAVAEARAEQARARIVESIVERGGLGSVQGDVTDSARAAIELYGASLARIDSHLAPRDWALTLFNRGVAYAVLAQGGDDGARAAAIVDLQTAASGFARLRDRESEVRARRLVDVLQTE